MRINFRSPPHFSKGCDLGEEECGDMLCYGGRKSRAKAPNSIKRIQSHDIKRLKCFFCSSKFGASSGEKGRT